MDLYEKIAEILPNYYEMLPYARYDAMVEKYEQLRKLKQEAFYLAHKALFDRDLPLNMVLENLTNRNDLSKEDLKVLKEVLEQRDYIGIIVHQYQQMLGLKATAGDIPLND